MKHLLEQLGFVIDNIRELTSEELEARLRELHSSFAELGKAQTFEAAAERTTEILRTSENLDFDDEKLAELDERRREERLNAGAAGAEALLDQIVPSHIDL